MNKPSTGFSLSSVMPVGRAMTIGKKSEIACVTFEIGKTDRRAVAETLGLPANISKSEALGREYWAYCAQPAPTKILHAAPKSTGVMRACMHPADQAGGYEYDNVDVVYVFDRNGVLEDVRQPGRKITKTRYK